MLTREAVKGATADATLHVAMRSEEFDWAFDDLGQFVTADDVPIDKIEHVHMKSPQFDWHMDDLGQLVDEEDTPLE